MTSFRRHPAADGGRARSSRALALHALVFVAGLASLAAEITASRLLAPLFGTSLVIWANVIGVVLLCLAVGYVVGGRLADRFPRRRPLHAIAAVSGLLVAASPAVAGALHTVFLRLPGGEAVGSLAAAAVLLGPPTLLLGCVSPWAIRVAVTGVPGAGRAAGRLYALSTAGSLAGSYLAVLVLIPLGGTAASFRIVGLTLLAVASVGLLLEWEGPFLGRRRPRGVAVREAQHGSEGTRLCPET